MSVELVACCRRRTVRHTLYVAFWSSARDVCGEVALTTQNVDFPRSSRPPHSVAWGYLVVEYYYFYCWCSCLPPSLLLWPLCPQRLTTERERDRDRKRQKGRERSVCGSLVGLASFYWRCGCCAVGVAAPHSRPEEPSPSSPKLSDGCGIESLGKQEGERKIDPSACFVESVDWLSVSTCCMWDWIVGSKWLEDTCGALVMWVF